MAKLHEWWRQTTDGVGKEKKNFQTNIDRRMEGIYRRGEYVNFDPPFSPTLVFFLSILRVLMAFFGSTQDGRFRAGKKGTELFYALDLWRRKENKLREGR